MDVLFLVASLAVLSIPLAVLGAAAAGDPPDLLAGLFRSSQELGWPIGVQEEDAPPHVPLEGDPPGESQADAAAWRTTVRSRVRIGSARR